MNFNGAVAVQHGSQLLLIIQLQGNDLQVKKILKKIKIILSFTLYVCYHKDREKSIFFRRSFYEDRNLRSFERYKRNVKKA